MARGTFLALVAPRRAPEAVIPLEARLAEADGWRRAAQVGPFRLWIDAAVSYPLQVLPHARGLVLGDLFDKVGVAPLASPLNAAAPDDTPPEVLARRLCAAHWGGYAALLCGADGAAAVFRDPSGHLPCLTWRLDSDVAVVASSLARAPAWLWPKDLRLDWDRIGQFISMTPAASGPLYEAVGAVGPGELQDLHFSSRVPSLIWRPADFVAPPVTDLEAVKRELMARVDDCTAAMARRHSRLIVELSGGLDSSIVAGALGGTGMAPRVAHWLNRAGDRADGDERAFARSVTDRLGVALTVAEKPLTPLEAADFLEMSGGDWPAINAVDVARDRDEVQRILESGATGLMSGDGGDAVFFQMPSPLVWADERRRRGLAAFASPVLADVARRTRQSVWSVVRHANTDRRGRAPPDITPSPFASEALRRASRTLAHPWVRDARARDLPSGKRLQITALANCHVFRGASRRAGEADLLFPLLAQPVVELCLAIATPDLAGGSYDRPFARSAFAERLPEMVRARRAKGALTGYFNRLVAASAPTLRPFLLEGCLAEAGMLDLTAVAEALEPSRLIWTSRGSGVLTLAAVEAWVRHWQGRVPDSVAAPRPRRRA